MPSHCGQVKLVMVPNNINGAQHMSILIISILIMSILNNADSNNVDHNNVDHNNIMSSIIMSIIMMLLSRTFSPYCLREPGGLVACCVLKWVCSERLESERF
jgi:hypothetical protein